MADAVRHSRQVDAISWALFLIWMGVVIWTEVGWAWSLLGISAIVLGAQAALSIRGDRVDAFWVACGLVLLASGVWLLFGLTWPLTPVLLVLLGVAMLGNALFGSHAH
jgi:hypothetical protein